MATTEAVGWAHYHPHLPELIDDPYPAYRWLREHSPVHHCENDLWDGWAVSRHRDILDSVRNHDVFAITVAFRPKFLTADASPYGVDPAEASSISMLGSDGDEHRRQRRLFTKLFTPRSVEAHRPAAEALFDRLLDAALERKDVDFAEDVAVHYLPNLVGALMGVPEPDRPFLNHAATVSSLMMAGHFEDEFFDIMGKTGEYWEAYAQSREGEFACGAFERGKPRDLTDVLFNVCHDGSVLNHAQIVGNLSLLSVGGNESTTQFLSAAAMFLAERPDVFQALRDDPSIIPAATEELLRYLSPVQGLTRTTTRDTTIGGTPLPAGANVLMLYGSGNHDPARYDEPDEFRIGRFPKGVASSDHLVFSQGIHVCLGAHLARLVTHVMLEKMVARVASLEMTGPVRRSPNAMVRVIEHLPMRLVAR